MTKRPRRTVRALEITALTAVVGGSDSRNIEFEMIKNEVQKLTTTTPPPPPPPAT
jgi:hypothetical protein